MLCCFLVAMKPRGQDDQACTPSEVVKIRIFEQMMTGKHHCESPIFPHTFREAPCLALVCVLNCPLLEAADQLLQWWLGMTCLQEAEKQTHASHALLQ